MLLYPQAREINLCNPLCVFSPPSLGCCSFPAEDYATSVYLRTSWPACLPGSFTCANSRGSAPLRTNLLPCLRSLMVRPAQRTQTGDRDTLLMGFVMCSVNWIFGVGYRDIYHLFLWTHSLFICLSLSLPHTHTYTRIRIHTHTHNSYDDT